MRAIDIIIKKVIPESSPVLRSNSSSRFHLGGNFELLGGTLGNGSSTQRHDPKLIWQPKMNCGKLLNAFCHPVMGQEDLSLNYY